MEALDTSNESLIHVLKDPKSVASYSIGFITFRFHSTVYDFASTGAVMVCPFCFHISYQYYAREMYDIRFCSLTEAR